MLDSLEVDKKDDSKGDSKKSGTATKETGLLLHLEISQFSFGRKKKERKEEKMFSYIENSTKKGKKKRDYTRRGATIESYYLQPRFSFYSFGTKFVYNFSFLHSMRSRSTVINF